MARIVDESYIEDLCSWIKGCDENFEIDMSRVLSEVKADLENMPEVVWCKDCKHSYDGVANLMCGRCGQHINGIRLGGVSVKEEHFCSYGERKGNAKE